MLRVERESKVIFTRMSTFNETKKSEKQFIWACTK